MNDETYTFENKEYVSPTVSRDEQTGFIDTLRQTGQENIDRINQETQALGSQIDPSKGGFSQGTQFESRYVTPQTDNIVAGLKAAAQQTALNQALTNLQNQWSQRYNEAYRNAKITEYNKANATTGNSNTDTADIETKTLDEDNPVSIEDTTITTPDESSNAGVSQQTIDTATATNAVTGGDNPYNIAGYPAYYVDANGNATGVRIYTGGAGAETPTQSFTGDGWKEFIRSIVAAGGRLYNSSGKDITTWWELIYK